MINNKTSMPNLKEHTNFLKNDTPKVIINNIPEEINNNTSIPAVTFKERNVYLADGTVENVEAPIYETFATISNIYMKNTLDKSVSNIPDIEKLTFNNTIDTIINVALDQFIIVIKNILNVFIHKVNCIFAGNTSIDIPLCENINDYNILSDAISSLFKYSSESKSPEEFYTKTFNFAISFINLCGENVYSNVQNHLGLICSQMVGNGTQIKDLYTAVDASFCLTMQNLCYEASVFAYNMIQIISPIKTISSNE